MYILKFISAALLCFLNSALQILNSVFWDINYIIVLIYIYIYIYTHYTVYTTVYISNRYPNKQSQMQDTNSDFEERNSQSNFIFIQQQKQKNKMTRNKLKKVSLYLVIISAVTQIITENRWREKHSCDKHHFSSDDGQTLHVRLSN